MVQSAKNAKMSGELLAEGRKYATKILEGLNASPSHFHAVNYFKDQLSSNGFTEIKETGSWAGLQPGQGYFFTRNNSTLCAFLCGSKVSEQPIHAFKIIGCHTDSPCLKIAPASKISALGYTQLNVMTYGGGLWRTWFDRDLTLAGKVIIQSEDGKRLESKYWNAVKPLMKVPSLAIHLDRSEEFKPNKETHVKPVISMELVNSLFGEGVSKIEDDKFNLDSRHLSTLTDLIAKDLGCKREQIVDFELNAADSQPSGLCGIHDEFVSSPRLDNLASSICSMHALIEHAKAPAERKNHAEVDMIMLFDHEEVGSSSAQGADSNMAVEITQRIFDNIGKKSSQQEEYFQAIHRSFLLSADMAHAVHPNYSEKHQRQHMPLIHEGIVLKINANQRYMTDSVGSSVLKSIALKAGVPLQEFIVRNDSLCGSTIGPMMAAKAGIKTIDIGAPQLSMHSIRETCGVVDLLYYQKLFAVFFNEYWELAGQIMSE